ncbi:MAG: hypothetical protein IJP27_10190 [Clostridia bacterium]|nr:hypothetical protein [Clostridia bacterium]
MDEKTAALHLTSLTLCDKLINELRSCEEEAHTFFGGELCRVYENATEQAIDKTQSIRRKLQTL